MQPNQQAGSEAVSKIQKVGDWGHSPAEHEMTKSESTIRAEIASLTSILADHLPPEARPGIEHALEDARGCVETVKTYVKTNPEEAAGLIMCAGALTWAVLKTKPGKYLFQFAAASAVPKATQWMQEHFGKKA